MMRAIASRTLASPARSSPHFRDRNKLEPLLGHVGRREDVVLDVLGVEGDAQSVFANSFFLLRRYRALERDRLGTLNNRGNDGAAEQVAAIENFFSSAAQRYLKKFIFLAAGKLVLKQTINQSLDRLTDHGTLLG